jgi:hypothetical protein
MFWTGKVRMVTAMVVLIAMISGTSPTIASVYALRMIYATILPAQDDRSASKNLSSGWERGRSEFGNKHVIMEKGGRNGWQMEEQQLKLAARRT